MPRETYIRETPFDSPVYLDGLQAEVWDEQPDPKPVAMFIAGGPLSGKTDVLNALQVSSDPFLPSDPVLIDPRAIREMLPEWPELMALREPQGAAMLFRESCLIARELTEEAIQGQRNLILDGIGASAEGEFAALLELFQGIGYQVRVLLVDAPTDIAEERNGARSERDGLLMDPVELRTLHRDVSRRFGEWSEIPEIAVQMYAGS